MAGLDFSEGSLDWGALEKNLGADVNSTKKSYEDNRFWKLSRDENDNGGAIIRLIPDPSGTPFIRRYNHAFQSFDSVNKKKRWYINISPQTIGDACPASDLWSKLSSFGTEESKKEAKKFSRKVKFIANIKVIKDPANPQNEGKIFLWEFGTKLKDKFMAALEPSESEIAMGESPKQLFNPLTGNNIKLKIKKASGFLNYDDTEIMGTSSIYSSPQEAKEDIIGNAHKLEDFLKPDAFETYEELKSKMKYVLEVYNPEFMDATQFKSIVEEVVGTVGGNGGGSGASQANQTPKVDNSFSNNPTPSEQSVTKEIDIDNEASIQPQTQTVSTEPKADTSDLDFLDDL